MAHRNSAQNQQAVAVQQPNASAQSVIREGNTQASVSTNATEDDLRSALASLEEAHKVQRGFISVVSHEFRTTLAGIQGFSELIRDRNLSTVRIKEFAHLIYDDARRLDIVIGDLLDLERMMVGQLQPDCDEIDVQETLRILVQQAQSSTSEHTIMLECPEKLPPLHADPTMFEQMIKHLLSNAINYAPTGGDVIVHADRQDSYVHLAIQDQGIGIAEDALDEIFMPFRRLKVPETRAVKGAGLGLSLVREIVKLHHGHIQVNSQPAHGSIFHILLPL